MPATMRCSFGFWNVWRSQGNILIVAGTRDETMRYADCVVDIGPGAGIEGGKVIDGRR